MKFNALLFFTNVVILLSLAWMGLWVPYRLITSSSISDILIGVAWGFTFWSIAGFTWYLYGKRR